MEMTLIQRLCAHLSRFHPLLIERDPSPLRQLFSAEPWPPDQSPDLQTLYVLPQPRAEILSEKASFLVFCPDPREAAVHPGPQTNALLVADSADSRAVMQAVTAFFRGAERFRRFCPLLLTELEGQNRLSHHLRLLTDFTGHPAAVLDARLHLLAHSGAGWMAASLPPQIQPAEAGAEWASLPSQPMLVEQPGVPRQLLVGLRSSRPELFLLQILEGDTPLGDSDRAFAAMAASFLQFRLSAEHRPDRQDSQELLIRDVITGKETNEHRIFTRAEALNFLLGSTNYLLLIYPDAGVGFRRTMQTVRELQALTPCTTMLLGSEIIMLLTGSRVMETVTGELIPYLEKQTGFKASLSAVFSGIPLMKNAYEQCCAARKLGSVLSPNGTWFDYEAYRELHFTNKYLSDADVEFFCLPVAKKIVQHDRIHKTRYAYTLMLYIKNFKNAATVARMMNIHRNTMFYRLEKIAEQFGIHYDNPVQMNNLSLSFNILASRYPDIFN